MDLEKNIQAVKARIEAACARADRDQETVAIVAVTKGQPPEVATQIAQLGLNLLGENKIQEAKAKILQCPGRIKWHFIGHLQTNKCRDAVELFEMIQSVDGLHLAQELEKRAEQGSKSMPVLLEVNVGGEATKFGYRP